MSIELPASSRPIGIVFDANILISAALAGFQAEYAVILVADERLKGFVSEPILADLERKLREKFHRSPLEVKTHVAGFRKLFQVVVPVTVDAPTLRDPRDLHVIGTAVAANADLILTTDKDLLTLKHFEEIAIVHPKTLRWTFPSGK